jgi:hypothetical protein
LKPVDLFFLIGIAMFVLILAIIILTIFRKRKKVARIIISIMVISYFIFFAIYPSIRSSMHAKRYDELEEYLQNTYPTEAFNIESRDYNNAIQFGDFDVSNKDTPNKVVVYRVKKRGEIIQLDGS